MELTSQQETFILQAVQAMFNATPGPYFEELSENLSTSLTLADFAQSLISSDFLTSRKFSFSNPPPILDFAQAFIDEFIGDHASTSNKVWLTDYIVNQWNAGIRQDKIFVELTQVLAVIPVADPNWGEAAFYFNKLNITRIVENLLSDTVSSEDKSAVIEDLLTQIMYGKTFGDTVICPYNA